MGKPGPGGGEIIQKPFRTVTFVFGVVFGGLEADVLTKMWPGHRLETTRECEPPAFLRLITSLSQISFRLFLKLEFIAFTDEYQMNEKFEIYSVIIVRKNLAEHILET